MRLDDAYDEEAEDPWMAWYRENEDTASNTGSRAGSWHRGYWYHGWHGRRWQAPETDSEDEETNIEVLPDVIKGWLLLEKAGLDTLERSIIQSDIKSQFSLQSVENALRAHWTDDQVRRRDGEGRAQANFEDYDDDDEPPEEVHDSFFEDWSEEEVALYQAARQSEAEAWAQVQQGRRTLREARERQKEVRLGRKFFPSKGSGKGSGGGARHQATSQGNQHPEGPCLRCGGKHATRSCPKRAEKDDRGALQVDNASAEFVYYQAESLFSEHSSNQVAEQAQNASAEVGYYQAESLFGDHEALSSQSEGQLTTPEAMRAGYGILDPGATKTMGSITALEYARAASWAQNRQDNIAEIDPDNRPTFGFADSESAKCSSTVMMQLPVAEQKMRLRVHALDKGSVPVLLSIDTLKRMRAIVDYGSDEVVFAGINPQKCVKLQTTSTGHQILPLTKDFMQGARTLKSPVRRLGQPADE